MSERAEALLEQIAARLSSIETLIVAGITGNVDVQSQPDTMLSAAPQGQGDVQWFCNACERPLNGDERCGPCFDARIGRIKR